MDRPYVAYPETYIGAWQGFRQVPCLNGDPKALQKELAQSKT
jgi:hypothetical protein